MNNSLLSPLNHSGNSLNFHYARFRERSEYFTQFKTYSGFGVLYNKANDSYITSLGFNGALSRHWSVNDSAHPLRLFLGGSIDTGINVWLKESNTNNPAAYFFNLSISPGILVKYRFSSKKIRFELGQQIDVPVGSIISSSNYSYTFPPGFVEKNTGVSDIMRLASLVSLKKSEIVTTLDIIPSLELRRKWPAFRISYMFSGMSYNHDGFSIKSVDHVILFGTILHLFR